MLFSLSFKNFRKSIRDYSIYFFTMILGVAVFYIFNAIETQTAMMEVTQTKAAIIRTMNGVLSGVSVFVSLVLGYLIVYASRFMLKKRKKMWVLYDTKVKGVELKFDVARNVVCVILEVNKRKESERQEMYERLTWYKETLEEGFPEGLLWDTCCTLETGKQVARIYVKKEGADFHRREDWGEIFSFMAENMYQLEKNFLNIAEYLKE